MSQNIPNLLNDIDTEIARTKLMLNNGGHHNGTALNAIVRRYRNELKQYRAIVHADLTEDDLTQYR